MDIAKFLTKTAGQAAKSLLLSEVKGTAKKFINLAKKRSAEDIQREVRDRIGYDTLHFAVSKQDQVQFKSSSVFFHEWLTSGERAGKLIKDEEKGTLYWENEPLTNAAKIALVQKFAKQTGIKAAGLGGHLEGALKLLDVQDLTSTLFKQHFAGWVAGTPSVIDGFLKNCYGEVLETENDYANLLFKKWMVGTARRAISPGSSFDGCLTLTGPAGCGKTQFFRQLLPDQFKTRSAEIYCNIKQPQKFVEAIIGKTIANFDELSVVLEHPKVIETFKQLLSSQWIDVRLPWRRNAARFNLRQGWGATTNRQKFIPDPFLSRRLWVIALNDKGRLNFDYLTANRTNLWKEAVYLAQQNEANFLTVNDQKVVEEHNQKYYV